jgi:OOP family OmpA-OmpF porin
VFLICNLAVESMVMKYLFCFLVFINTVSYSQSVDPFAGVNSPYDEQSPVFSPDGKTLYISIANHPQNIGGKKDPGDIWISTKQENIWSVPIHGGSVLNNTAFNGVAAVSKDGNELYLLSHYKVNGSAPATQGISVSRKTNPGWSTPQNIIIPYFINRSTSLGGYLYQYQSLFIVSAESYNTVGAEDLYVSFNRDGKWTELINLGSVINTPFQEMSPSLSADGSKLYFASNGRKSGMGSFDIYVSNRLDDSWTSWSEPINMGTEINSDGRELYFREFSSLGFSVYTSTRNSDGYGDVRILKDSLNNPPIEEISNPVVEVPPAAIADNAIKIAGRVTNSKTGEGIPARLIFRSDSVYTTSGSKEGIYDVGLKPAQSYSIEIEAPGFVNLSEKLDIQSIDMNRLEMNFKLQPIEVGAVVNLKSVLFEMGSITLLEESYSELNVIVDFLKSNPKVEIELEGHTDNRGDTKKNLVLSQQRVDKIKSYLVSKGISARRIKGKGYGGSQPIATNNTEEARRLNRRVEFRILKY